MNILEVHTLTKRFGGVVALKDISFDIPERLICGFIGPNGAGKTTLFNVITGTFRPSSGQVKLRGQFVTGMKSSALVKLGVARTHQVARPFKHLTVLENVQVGVHYGRQAVSGTTAARALAMEMLLRVGLDHKAHLLAGVLSLGDQKRLEVGRALATQPDLLLLDEICGGLNSSETNAMLDLLQRIRESGATIMYVEHDMKAVMSICDRITVLEFGQKLAEGKPEEIRKNEAVIKAYLGSGASV
ncbi:MAG TPA: ABC transporter ATP-binding protein [Candidatus Saccharimonadales bacterium]|jgi:branched-chain amino acid transport system ATP-binding protein|nr:ABC transporter ATP-binding protein [Candidatus Saccharimonadales bacterium]